MVCYIEDLGNSQKAPLIRSREAKRRINHESIQEMEAAVQFAKKCT